jgi:simple sugar transport system ATP-binding protein
MTAMRGAIDATIDKVFGTTPALRGATLSVRAGTVHALVGENGAGKSTLVRIVGGVLAATSGALAIDGKAIELARWDRVAARAAGIGIVQQHGAFAGTLSVVENTVLGVEPRRGPLVMLDATANAIAALGKRVGLPVDPWAPADSLSLAARQRAEIVAALHHGARVLLLDEPTAILTPLEVDGLLATLRALAASGTTIVIVTHKLDEVRDVADAVTVLRAGATVATFDDAADGAAIAHAMVGSALPAPTQLAAPPADAPPALTLVGVEVAAAGSRSALAAIELAVARGEIVGVAGVDGNGQHELAHAIAGLVAHRGRIALGARDVSTASPGARLAAGLAHIPEDRHHGGLLLDASVADNLALGRRDITGRFVIDRAAVARHADAQIAALDIRPPDRAAIVRALSGGNQQKIVVARELSRPALTAVLAVHPTRGVDLGAVARIHDRLRAAAAGGAGVLVISADLDELLALCHRVVVMLRGRIVGTRAGAALRAPDVRSALGALMAGADATPARETA